MRKHTMKFRRALSLLLTLLLCMSFATPAFAAQGADDVIISPQYSDTAFISASLSLEDRNTGRMRCVGTVVANDTTSRVNLTMTLYRLTSSGQVAQGTWTTSGSGGCTMSKTRCVISGYKYTLVATAQVYNSSGVYQETASASATYDFR